MESFEQLVNQFTNFSLNTFEAATAISSLKKLESEIKEVIHELESQEVSKTKLATEYADCLMCIFDSSKRAGITTEYLIDAFRHKLELNINRKWIRNRDNTYSHT